MGRASLAWYGLMVRAVPRVAPLHAVAAASAVMTALVLVSGDPALAQSRLRFAGAGIAASLACVLDDAAAPTLAGSPATLRARRAVRALVAVALGAVALAVVVLCADARSGMGRPPGVYLLEAATLACISLAVGAVAIRFGDDGRGGIAGAVVALVCYSGVYLPQRWWWPLTAAPETPRLLMIAAAAVAVGAVASTDPATSAPWRRNITSPV